MATDLEMYARSLGQISFDLYREIDSMNTCKISNIFISPISINVALAMAYVGANGNTKKQLLEFLFGKHFVITSDDESSLNNQLHNLFGNTITGMFSGNEKVQFQLANRLFAHSSFVRNLLDSFTQILKEKYRSELQPIDFGNGQESAELINRWVCDQTHDKIKNLINQDSVSEDTRLILVNAIYFKGEWSEKFSPDNTSEQIFYSGPNQETQVDMMFMYGKKFFYHNGDTFEILGMPYADENLKMMIILPKDRFGLADVEKSLDGAELVDTLCPAWKGEKFKINKVAIPKFKLEQTVGLVPILAKLGVNDMFDNADFSGINGRRDLVVSNVVHKAFVEVNEEGTEAAAATAMELVMKCGVIGPKINFIADHPFLFMIAGEGCVPLFIGRYCCK